jgi:hypothetical protein
MPLGGREPGCFLCAVFFLSMNRDISEELVRLNFRELGTRYSPVLLSFGLLLLLGGLALDSGLPVSPLTVSGNNPSTLANFAAPDPGASRAAVRTNFGQFPLSFEPNRGQTDPRVKFLARGAGYGMFLTSDQAVLTLRSTAKKSSVVRMQLAGANPSADATGISQLPGKSNYFVGNNPASQHPPVRPGALSKRLSRG